MGIDFGVTLRLPGTDLESMSSGRVTLRRFTRADLDRRCTWPPYDEPVFSHLNLHLDTPRRRDAWFDREWSAREPFWFAVDDETGELVGTITLRDVQRWKRITRIGVHLHPKRLGRGYGTETMRLFLDYYFDRLGYRMLKLDVAVYNTRAVRCYEKLGFTHDLEFWRQNLSGADWLTDGRFADVRWAVELHRGTERIRHYEMHLTREQYREGKPEERST
ncbi:MAG TPA: GNAT family N-acetyltransferase, partial [Planctomycetota bacterium]|nr:GNAT family N-acetyltransferase [Planctomycetota bacterium]